jgi:hypothetical protein
MTLKNILIFGFFTLLVFACSRDKLKVDSSQIKVSTRFINLDSIITHSNPDQLIKFHSNFQNSIKGIYDYQLGYCLQIGKVVDTAFINSIGQFKADKGIIGIEKSIQSKFDDLEFHKKSILEGLQHLKYHFPEGKIPEHIVFMNSLFNSNAFSTDKEIGIGLERYLGYENEMIQKLPSEPFYDWIKKAMDETYLERDAICSWILTHYVPEVDGVLAEHIIYWGKVLYLTEASFPDLEKNIILRYNEKQFKWANENESSFWKYLIDEKLLFKINGLEKANLLNEGPFTIGLPEESPDRLGQFLGWKMVRNYMSKNDVTLKELIELPYNTILQEYEIED